MDYEKEYKKLKADIRKAYLYAQTDSTKAVLESILPELKESEDERIRKAIIESLKARGQGSFAGYPMPTVLAWLEKQREHIWHDCTLEPPTKFGETLIVLCKNKNFENGIWLADTIQSWDGEYKPRENWEKPIKWAYLTDLLPTK